MADFNFGELMDAGRQLIDNPPPGFAIDMHPSTVAVWLGDKERDRITVQLLKTPPESRPAVLVVVLTSGLDRAMKALTGSAGVLKPGETPVTARELRLASYVGRMLEAVRQYVDCAPGMFLTSGARDRYRKARAAAIGVLQEFGALDGPKAQAGDVPPQSSIDSFISAAARLERDAGRSTATEQPQSTIPDIYPQQVPLILPDRPEESVTRVTTDAAQPKLPPGYEWGTVGHGGLSPVGYTVTVPDGGTLMGCGKTVCEAAHEAAAAAWADAGKRQNEADRQQTADEIDSGRYELPAGYEYTGNAYGVHKPGPWTQYVRHVESGERLYGHGLTPAGARVDAATVAKNHAASASDSNDADIVDALKMRFDSRIVFPDKVAQRAAAEIERLRRELDAARAGVVELKRHREKQADELAELRKEVAAVLDKVPNRLRIDVRPGGGPENVAATLAVTVANVVMMHDRMTGHAAELADKLKAAEAQADRATKEATAAGADRAKAMDDRTTWYNKAGELHTKLQQVERMGDYNAERVRVMGVDLEKTRSEVRQLNAVLGDLKESDRVLVASRDEQARRAAWYRDALVRVGEVLSTGGVRQDAQRYIAEALARYDAGVKTENGGGATKTDALSLSPVTIVITTEVVGGKPRLSVVEKGRPPIHYLAPGGMVSFPVAGIQLQAIYAADFGAVAHPSAPASGNLERERERERERADRMREEAVFFGARNGFYRAAMRAAHDLLTEPGNITGQAEREAIKALAEALDPTNGPKRRSPGLGDRGPDLFGELLAYREAVADVLTCLEAWDKQYPGSEFAPLRSTLDTLRIITDHSATPRQMKPDAERQPVLMRLLEDAQRQLTELRAAVSVAGFGVVPMPGGVRLQDMRPEPGDNDEEGDSDSRDSCTDWPPRDENDSDSPLIDERESQLNKLREELWERNIYAAGLRALLNFAELRARTLAWVMTNPTRAAMPLEELDKMGRLVRATLTANAQAAGLMTVAQYARAAKESANEVRLLIGERDNAAADFYAIPLGFAGPR